MKALKSRRIWQQAVSLLSSLVLAGNLLVATSAMANEGDTTFKVEIGHLSENVRALAHSHGWSLEWASDEDRIIIRPFDMANPSLDVALSKIFSPYKDTFSTALDQEKKVVRVTTAGQEAPEEGMSDSEGEEGLRWSKELDFEPDLESTTPPEPPPFDGEKKTVRMLDLPQAWESEGAEPVTPVPTELAKQQTSVEELSSEQKVQDDQAPEPSETLADPQDRVVSAEKPGTVFSPASPEPVLQILSTKDRGKAEKELARLRDLGHDAFLEEFHHNGTLWHRLKIRLASGQSVEDAKAELKGLGHSTVWIVP